MICPTICVSPGAAMPTRLRQGETGQLLDMLRQGKRRPCCCLGCPHHHPSTKCGVGKTDRTGGLRTPRTI
jgi:hypothetical protein